MTNKIFVFSLTALVLLIGCASCDGTIKSSSSSSHSSSSSSSTVSQGTSANTISEDGTYTGNTYTSTGDDENALRIDGATVTLTNITVNKSAGSSSDTECGDFYGMNAALLTADSTITSITEDGTIVYNGHTLTVNGTSYTSTTPSSS